MAPFELTGTNIDSINQAFNEHGFVVVRSFFSKDEIAELRRALDRYVAETVPALNGTDVVFEKNGTAIRNLFRMEQHDTFFDTFGRRPEVLSVADVLANGKASLRAVQTFNKPAAVGSPVPQHQDNAYFCLTPPDAFTMWVAVDAATEENGPVHYLPGTHTLGSLEHVYSGQAGNSLKMSSPRRFEKEDVYRALMDPGDVIFHHCRTIHFSGPNTSGKNRVGMVIPYAGTHVEEDATLKKTYEAVSATVGKPLRH